MDIVYRGGGIGRWGSISEWSICVETFLSVVDGSPQQPSLWERLAYLCPQLLPGLWLCIRPVAEVESYIQLCIDVSMYEVESYIQDSEP